MTHWEADCETFTYVRTSQVLKCWLGFFPLQPPSLGQSVHCKPSDVCLQKLAPWSRPGMVAGGPCGEDRRTWCPFCLLTCAIFSGAPCTLASVLSQDTFDGRLFFFFLGYICFDFYKKTSLWASLKYHSTFTPWIQECLPSPQACLCFSSYELGS